jgi:hypothetical protein
VSFCNSRRLDNKQDLSSHLTLSLSQEIYYWYQSHKRKSHVFFSHNAICCNDSNHTTEKEILVAGSGTDKLRTTMPVSVYSKEGSIMIARENRDLMN